METIKPPLGVSPHWFVYLKRMKELNEAIGRFLEYIDTTTMNTKGRADYYEAIAEWSVEITQLALLEVKLERMEDDGTNRDN